MIEMTKPLYLIGDIHGDVRALVRELTYIAFLNDKRGNPEATILQIGDYGCGYDSELDHFFENDIRELLSGPAFEKLDYSWFRGNHDDVKVAQNMYGNIGDFGTHPTHEGLFFVAGAYTPPFFTGRLFENEQLTEEQCAECLELYKETKPSLVVSHDCPEFLVRRFYPKQTDGQYANRTTALLQEMFEYHEPDYWFFGHHHKDVEWKVANTTFRCVNSNSTASLVLNPL